MSEELNQPKVDYKNPFHVRDVYIAVPSGSIAPVFKWLWDDEERCYKYVEVGEQDFDALVQASAGQDVASVISRQPGSTAMEKFANAVDAGLVPAVNGDPFAVDYTAPILDGSEIPDVIRQQKLVREGDANVAALNKALGRAAGEEFSAADFLAGKADAVIKEYLDKRIAAAAEKGEEK